MTGCSGGDSWYVDRTDALGVDFMHEPGATGRFWLPEIMGAGVAVFDYDRDGDLDLYFTNGNFGLPEGHPDGQTTNRLYRQEADGRFTDVTEASGAGDGGYAMGVAVGDIDNDGYPDLYVTNLGSDRLYRNTGDGRFEDITAAANIDVPGWSTSAAFCDFDGDRFEDLYVTRYIELDPELTCTDSAGRLDYCGPQAMPAVSDKVLYNTGTGQFVDRSVDSGIGAVSAPGLGVVCDDFDRDGQVDVYVANDAEANQLWLNRGDQFEDAAVRMGAAYNREGDAEAGMGVLSADLDGNGWRDLFLTHLVQQTNTFYRRLDDGSGFEDASESSGLGRPSVEYTGFGTLAHDVDLDADLDVLVANGRVRLGFEPAPGAPGEHPWNRLAEPNQLLVNHGGGQFEPDSAERCGFCGRVEISRGLAAGDINRDGRLDIVITNINGPARVYFNEAPPDGGWLLLTPVDPMVSDGPAIGAEVVVRAGGREQRRRVARDGSYLSSSDPAAHFGLGAAEVESVEVLWPDGDREAFGLDCADCARTLRRGEGEPLQ